MRSLGAIVPAKPKAEGRTKVGATEPAASVVRNLRRENCLMLMDTGVYSEVETEASQLHLLYYTLIRSVRGRLR